MKLALNGTCRDWLIDRNFQVLGRAFEIMKHVSQAESDFGR